MVIQANLGRLMATNQSLRTLWIWLALLQSCHAIVKKEIFIMSFGDD